MAENPSTTNPKLLPCPFCGEAAVMTQLLEGPEKKPGKWQVMCGHIACYGTKGPIGDSDRAAAIIWNIRDSDLLEALREIAAGDSAFSPAAIARAAIAKAERR